MNECLNSDDDDEEDHRGLFTSFELIHGKSCADLVLSGDTRQRSLTMPCPFPILLAKNTHRRINSPLLMYPKQNGLITWWIIERPIIFPKKMSRSPLLEIWLMSRRSPQAGLQAGKPCGTGYPAIQKRAGYYSSTWGFGDVLKKQFSL